MLRPAPRRGRTAGDSRLKQALRHSLRSAYVFTHIDAPLKRSADGMDEFFQVSWTEPQGCIKLAVQPKPGRGVSPKRPCLGRSGRLGEASLPELDAALTQPGFGIAHDFNNLLTMILLNLELAQTLIPPGEELAHHLEQAKQAGLMAGGLTQQLLDLCRGRRAGPEADPPAWSDPGFRPPCRERFTAAV